MKFTNILLEKKDQVAKITLNRPDKLNAIDMQTIQELAMAVEDIENDDSVRAVVITGAGRAFSAGADLQGVKGQLESPQLLEKFMRQWHKTYNAIENMSKPTVAAINGFALAGGLELVMVCDLAIAAEGARIGDQHTNFGLIPGGGDTQRLPRALGSRRAKQLMLTGDWISPTEAERIGLINQVVPADQLEKAVKELTDKLIDKSPLASKTIKFLVNRGMQTDLATGLDLEVQAAVSHFSLAEDVKEGLRAFEEKRKPVFKGK